MRKSVPSNQVKALSMSVAGAIVAAVVTMLVPTAMLEVFTGATGLSELVPAAAAPLGDTARAMIAFAAGALTLAVLAYLLLRQESAATNATPETSQVFQGDAGAENSFKDRLARIALPKMPWQKGDDDITDLSDLPKLRNGDVHPDAPPRRPLSAQQDLPVLDLEEVAVPAVGYIAVPVMEEFEPAAAIEAVPVSETESPETRSQADPVAAEPAIQPTLAEMVAQLEAAVAERQKQLAELEAVATQLGAGSIVAGEVAAAPAEIVPPSPEPVRAERRPLEAVPHSVKDDDMDSALAAALATLHRMNGTDR